jgi:phage protein D
VTPVTLSRATQPRMLALANSERLVGVVSFEVENNTYYQADTFHITLCLSAQPPSRNWAWWASQVEIEMEMLLGYPATEQFDKADLTSVLIGEVDEIEIDPIRDEIVMSGRDLTSRFLDNKTVNKYPNLTASQIATQLATTRGLIPVVTATKVKAGTYYDIDKTSIADDRPEWDLLTYLAQVSNFVVYVKGRELHFEPKPAMTTTPYVIQWQNATAYQASPTVNTVDLSMSRNLSISKDISVSVRSYNVVQKKGFTVTANRLRVKAGTKTASKSYLQPQKYFFTIANKTPDEAQQYANQKLAEISQHEMKITATIPGDPTVMQQLTIKLAGTGTAFDQLFYPASVLHSYDLSSGYTTKIHAKNSSPDSTVAP